MFMVNLDHYEITCFIEKLKKIIPENYIVFNMKCDISSLRKYGHFYKHF